MKYTLLIIAISCQLSCQTKKDATNSPLFVLEQVKQNINNADTKTFTTHLCEKTARVINTSNTVGEILLGTRGKAIVDLIKKKVGNKHLLQFDNIHFKNEHIEGTTATVDAYNDKKEKTVVYHFVKENKEWKLCW